MLRGLLDAIRTLSCRVCALGLEPRLIHAHSAIEDFDSPFLMQNIEVNTYLDAYARLLAGEIDAMEDARHLLVMLDQCEDVVLKIRRGAVLGHQRGPDLPAGGAGPEHRAPAQAAVPGRRQRRAASAAATAAVAIDADAPGAPPTAPRAPRWPWPRNWSRPTTPNTRCAACCATISTCWRAT
jgi:hypothetical protein